MKALTELQKKLVSGLSAEATRLLNDMVTFSTYYGQSASTAAKVELKKKGIVAVEWHSFDPVKDHVRFTCKGKQIAAKLPGLFGKDES